MKKIIRIGGAGGFLGDSQTAAPQLLASGQVDYLMLDYLAEVTMSLLARSQRKHPEGGYARDFTDWVWRDNLRALKAGGVRLVTNAGGLNPAACRERMEAIAKEQGLSFKIAIVEGDDLRPRISEFAEAAREMFTDAAFPQIDKVLSANAYFGAFPIAAAFAAGAEVVITGRVVDSALALGPLIHEFGWSRDDYDRLASGSLVGHVLECGAQCTGGLFTDWEQVPDWAHIGYPIAECFETGDFIITKPQGSGGLVTEATVAEQILYEIGDPQDYALPDVICDLTQVTVKQVGEDRVLVSGATGRPPSGRYKVCLTFEDGWRVLALSPVVGRDAARKAERQALAVLERVEELLRNRNLVPFRATRIEALGSEASYGAQGVRRDTREVVCKVGVEHEDPKALEIFLREFESPTTSMSVGSTGWFGSRPAIAPVVRIFSFLVDRARITPSVDIAGEKISLSEPVAPDQIPAVRPPAGAVSSPDPAASVHRPLIDLAWARSGDKGDAFNIGVIARRPEYLPYIRAALSEEAVRAFFAHEFEGAQKPEVLRYELPGLNALNFHLKQSLGGGQMATLRLDALAKGKAQQLLDWTVPAPLF